MKYGLPEYDQAVKSFLTGRGREDIRANSRLLEHSPMTVKEQLGDTLLGAKGDIMVTSTFKVEGEFILTVEKALAGDYQSLYMEMQKQRESMLSQIETAGMAQLSDLCDCTGQVVKKPPGPLTYSKFLELFEKTQISFSYDGRPQLESYALKQLIGGRVATISLEEIFSAAPVPVKSAIYETIVRKREEFLANRRVRRLPRRT